MGKAAGVSPDFSPGGWKDGADEPAEKSLIVDNHPGAQGATPPESGGVVFKNSPPQMRRGGAPSAGVVLIQHWRVSPQPVKACHSESPKEHLSVGGNAGQGRTAILLFRDGLGRLNGDCLIISGRLAAESRAQGIFGGANNLRPARRHLVH